MLEGSIFRTLSSGWLLSLWLFCAPLFGAGQSYLATAPDLWRASGARQVITWNNTQYCQGPGTHIRENYGIGGFEFSLPAILQDGKWLPRMIAYPFQASGGGWSAAGLRTETVDVNGLVTVNDRQNRVRDDGPYIYYYREFQKLTVDLKSGAWSYTRLYKLDVTVRDPQYCNISSVEHVSGTGYTKIVLQPIQASRSLSLVNPMTPQRAIPIEPTQAPNAEPASMLAADGSAVAVVFRSETREPVSFDLTSSNAATGKAFGSLTPFVSTYVTNPSPGSSSRVTVSPAFCDGVSGGDCTFLALLWAPNSVPVAGGAYPSVTLTVKATQSTSTAETSIQLVPPPVILVHGLWSSADAAWPPFVAWLEQRYPHEFISPMDYGPLSHRTFRDSQTQARLKQKIDEMLARLIFLPSPYSPTKPTPSRNFITRWTEDADLCGGGDTAGPEQPVGGYSVERGRSVSVGQ
jgi:hypothetical protein